MAHEGTWAGQIEALAFTHSMDTEEILKIYTPGIENSYISHRYYKGVIRNKLKDDQSFKYFSFMALYQNHYYAFTVSPEK